MPGGTAQASLFDELDYPEPETQRAPISPPEPETAQADVPSSDDKGTPGLNPQGAEPKTAVTTQVTNAVTKDNRPTSTDDVPPPAGAKQERPEHGFVARITPPACTAVDRSWWAGAYGQWDTSNVGRKGVPSAMVKFAREAEAGGWAVALRAGSVAVDEESSLGVWECEASGKVHDNRQGGESLAVLSLMWTQTEGAKRWTFDTKRSGAEIAGRILSAYVTLNDYRRALSQARVRQVDPAAEAAEAAARETANRADREAAEAAQRAHYAAEVADHAREWERATDQQAERFGAWVADGDVLWLGDYAAAWRTWSAIESAEAYAAVMVECQAHREEISRLWSVERGHVPPRAEFAREVAESATRDVQTLMTRAAEAEGTPDAADMIRREMLPAIVSAREAVEAYDAHRSQETREHRVRAVAAAQDPDEPAPEAPAVDEPGESMLDPERYRIPESHQKATRERAEQREPYEIRVDQAAAVLAVFDETTPAPELRTAPIPALEPVPARAVPTLVPAPDAPTAEPTTSSGDRTANDAQAPSEPEPPGDEYGTVDVCDAVGVMQPKRVANPAPQDEHEVKAVRPEAVPAGPEATAPAPPEYPVTLATPADTEALQVSLQAPVEATPAPPRTESAVHAGELNTPPGTNGGTIPEKQVPQVATQTNKDMADKIRDRFQQSEEHISALRELFEALASASGTSTPTANNSSSESAAQEAKPTRPILPTALTRARADLDIHLEAINDSPRATSRLRTELGTLIAQIDQTLPRLNQVPASQRPTLLNRALDLLVHTAERLSDLAARLHAPAAGRRIEQLTERLRENRLQSAESLLAPRADRQLRAYASTQRMVEDQLATPGLRLAERNALQEEWLLTRARWHNHYKAHHGEPPQGLIPHDRSRIAGYPTTPSLRPGIIQELAAHLRRRATDLAAAPATVAQAELFVILAAAYEQQSPPTSTPATPQPRPSSFRSHPAADRPDVRATARRLAHEATERAANTAETAPTPHTAGRTASTHSEQQRTVNPASVPAARVLS